MSPFLAALQLNTEAVKYTLLAVSSPFWWPFVRELWREFNDILAEEAMLAVRIDSVKNPPWGIAALWPPHRLHRRHVPP